MRGGRKPLVVLSIVNTELATFVLVPISKLPHHLPKVVLLLPITVVLLPSPIAVWPITIWLVSLSALARLSAPINTELLVIVFPVVPFAINRPASRPIAVLLLPVVLLKSAKPPFAVLKMPVVLF
jgi:hypothetical protein